MVWESAMIVLSIPVLIRMNDMRHYLWPRGGIIMYSHYLMPVTFLLKVEEFYCVDFDLMNAVLKVSSILLVESWQGGLGF